MLLINIRCMIGFGLLIFSFKGIAFNCESQVTGEWEQSSTWLNCNNDIPQNDDSVTIKNGNTVILSSLTNNLESLFIEGGGDLSIITGTSFFVSINANNSITSSIDLSNATMDLTNNLIINANNKNLLVGTVNGDFELTLNSSAETHLTNTIGGEIPLSSLITDSSGTTYLADPNGAINIESLFINGVVTFNDPVILAKHSHIKAPDSSIIFNNTINSLIDSQFALTIQSSPRSLIELNSNIGLMGRLVSLTISNSENSQTTIRASQILTSSKQRWDTNVLLDSPTDTVSMDSNSGEVRFGKLDGGFSIRSLIDNEESLIIDTTSFVTLYSNVGDNNQKLNNLSVNSASRIDLKQDLSIVNQALTFNAPIVLFKNVNLLAENIDLQNSVDNAGFDLTLETIGAQGDSHITGVLSGSGNLVKNGDGELGFASINTTTGNVIINEGIIYTDNNSENVIPSVPFISVGAMGDFRLFSNDTDVFKMQSSQTINGTGQLGDMFDTIIVPSGAVITPGFSPGRLTGQIIKMETGSQLTMELNGLNAGAEYDQLVTDVLDLDADSNGGALLDLIIADGFVPAIGESFKIIDVIDSSLIVGTFNNLLEGAQIFIEDTIFTISYLGGDGNDVVLSVVEFAKIYVDNDATPRGDGRNWVTAYDNLQDALALAVSGNEIWVAQGVYYPDVGNSQLDGDRLATFVLKEGVSLYGGFNGTESNLNQRNVDINTTILSGDVDNNDSNLDANNISENTTDVVGGNSYHIVNGAAVFTTTVFDGFTVTAGLANENSNSFDFGAGMFCGNNTSGPSINQSVFIGHYASNRGSATYGCSQMVTNSSFINNYSDDFAGAVYAIGGLYENVLFLGNSALRTGGALRNNNEISITIRNSKFIANYTDQGNGAGLYSHGQVTMENVLFSGNAAGMIGSHEGGGVYIQANNTSELINVSMTGNRANGMGGAIAISGSATLNLRNSIIWNNYDITTDTTATSSIHVNGGTYTQINSLVQNFGTSGVGNLDEDPLLLIDTDPTTAPTTLGNAHLMRISIAIDKGDNNFITPATKDLDGRKRIVNGSVDMGAYEHFDEQVFKDGFE